MSEVEQNIATIKSAFEYNKLLMLIMIACKISSLFPNSIKQSPCDNNNSVLEENHAPKFVVYFTEPIYCPVLMLKSMLEKTELHCKQKQESSRTNFDDYLRHQSKKNQYERFKVIFGA